MIKILVFDAACEYRITSRDDDDIQLLSDRIWVSIHPTDRTGAKRLLKPGKLDIGCHAVARTPAK